MVPGHFAAEINAARGLEPFSIVHQKNGRFHQTTLVIEGNRALFDLLLLPERVLQTR